MIDTPRARTRSAPDGISPFFAEPLPRHALTVAFARYVAEATEALDARGIDLYLSRDLGRLVRLNAEERASWPLHLPPALDPAQAGFGPEDAFMVEGRDREGALVFTEAARLVTLHDTSLASELESLRLFYADPAPRRAMGEWITVETARARAMVGRIGFLGGIWIRPDRRGDGLSRIFATLVRWYAHFLWDLDWVAAVVGSRLVEKGVAAHYGYEESAPGIRTRTEWADADWHLISQSRAQIEGHIRLGSGAMIPRDDGAAAATVAP